MSKSTIVAIAKLAQVRRKAEGWKTGNKGDERAHFEFWIGAAAGLDATGNKKEADHVFKIISFLIAIRGLSELDKLATDTEGEPN